MGFILLIIFIGLFIYELSYYKNDHLNYTYPIISFFLFTIQLFSVLQDINVPYLGIPLNYGQNNLSSFLIFSSYYLGYFSWVLGGLILTYIPIYKNQKEINDINILKHIYNIITGKTNCARIDYWFSFIVILYAIFLITFLLFFLQDIFNFYIEANIIYFLVSALIILDLFLQARRLEDANISKKFLLIRLVGILGVTFFWISYLIVAVIMFLPSTKINIESAYIGKNK